jgi:hypothetical protein
MDGWRQVTQWQLLFISRIEIIIQGPPWSFREYPSGLVIFDTYLVEARGALLLIRGTIYGKQTVDNHSGFEIRALQFEVCEADFQSLQWVHMRSVGGDQVLFLGPRCSKSVCASQYNLKGNCHRIVQGQGSASDMAFPWGLI